MRQDQHNMHTRTMMTISIPLRVKRLLSAQAAFGVFIAVLLTLFNLTWGYSAAIGVTALVLPTAVVALFAFRDVHARQGGQLLASLLVGELLKMMLAVGIFLYALLRLDGVEPLALLGAYLATWAAGVVLPILIKN